MAYLDYIRELSGWVPKLPEMLAKKLVNRAYRDIREAYPWSFLVQEFDIVVPNLISAGTVAVTQYTPTVTGDAVASVAWTGLANPLLTLRQFRQAGGAIYNIIAADFTNPVAVILTLDRNFQGATSAAAGYQIYQVYYPAPSSTFLRWVSCLDPVNAYRFKSHDLHWTKAEIDRIDPQRSSAGQAYQLASYKTGTVGAVANIPFFELWPHVTSAQNLVTLWQDKGSDFVADTEVLPPQIPEEMLTYRARYHAYEWAEASKGAHQEMQLSNWLALRAIAKRDYLDALNKAMKNDAEAFLQLWIEQDGAFMGPISSDWLQTHASPYG